VTTCGLLVLILSHPRELQATFFGLHVMNEHDPRCDGGDDEKVFTDVADYGWHVVRVLEKSETPGWAFSIGMYRNFNHPEIVVFGLDGDLLHSVINSIGEGVRTGRDLRSTVNIQI
jgi:hypothetical protein